MDEAQLDRLRARAHVHSVACYAGQSRVLCGKREDADLAALLAAYEVAVTPRREVRPEPHPPNTALGRRVGVDRDG